MEELCELASWFPEHVSRMVLLAGQIGLRQNVWFALTDEMLDLRAETITIPAWLAKSRREHCIYPNAVEMKFLREQLMVRAAGTNLVFPTVEGKNGRRTDSAIAFGLNQSKGRPQTIRAPRSRVSPSTCFGIPLRR
jgi:hypothetical protein